MKFGVNTFIWSGQYDGTVQAQLPRIRAASFDGIEVPIFAASDFPAAMIRRDTASLGLECTVCSVVLPGMSLISEDAAIRYKTRAHLEDSIRAVAEAGSRILAGPMYCPVGYLPGRRRTS